MFFQGCCEARLSVVSDDGTAGTQEPLRDCQPEQSQSDYAQPFAAHSGASDSHMMFLPASHAMESILV